MLANSRVIYITESGKVIPHRKTRNRQLQNQPLLALYIRRTMDAVSFLKWIPLCSPKSRIYTQQTQLNIHKWELHSFGIEFLHFG